MADNPLICTASIAPLVGAEIITTGDILKSDTAFPPAVTRFAGGLASVVCEKKVGATSSSFSKILAPLARAPLFPGRSISEQATRKFKIDFSYSKGSSKYSLKLQDLPIGQNALLASVAQFHFNNAVETHRLQLMLNWPISGSLLEWKHIQLLDLWGGIGLLGVIAESTSNLGEETPLQERTDYALMIALKLEAAVVTVITKDVRISIVAGGSALVGSAFGFSGFTTFNLAQNRN